MIRLLVLAVVIILCDSLLHTCNAGASYFIVNLQLFVSVCLFLIAGTDCLLYPIYM